MASCHRGLRVVHGHRRRRRFLLLTSLAVAVLCQCSAEAPAPLQVAPLGAHDVPVGATWLVDVLAVGGVAPLRATLETAPPGVELWQGEAGRAVVEAAAGARPATACAWLSWQPTRFDLAPTQAGTARVPGPVHPVVVRVEDASGALARATGTIRSAPATAGGGGATAPKG